MQFFHCCSFWFVFSYGSKVWPPCESKMCFASTRFALMGISSSISVVPTNSLQSKLTAFHPEYSEVTIKTRATPAPQPGCSYHLSIGSVALFHAL